MLISLKTIEHTTTNTTIHTNRTNIIKKTQPNVTRSQPKATSTSNEWFFEGDDDSEIIALDYHSSISQFLSSLKQILDQPAAKFDDESRHGIVKALSQYATQLYADLGAHPLTTQSCFI